MLLHRPSLAMVYYRFQESPLSSSRVLVHSCILAYEVAKYLGSPSTPITKPIFAAMSGIYLLLGSNIGRRLKNLDRAKELIVSNGITIKKESQIYETAAWGNEDQEAFLNQVIEIETKKSPQRLLQITQLIENEMGRVRYEKWGKRLIDIDILYFNDLIFQENDLSLPHPGIADRRFTLVPLVEIASEMMHPVLEKTQAELLSVCEDQLEVSVFDQY